MQYLKLINYNNNFKIKKKVRNNKINKKFKSNIFCIYNYNFLTSIQICIAFFYYIELFTKTYPYFQVEKNKINLLTL